MIKKLLVLAVLAVAGKLVYDKVQGAKDADLWAEATDTVHSGN